VRIWFHRDAVKRRSWRLGLMDLGIYVVGFFFTVRNDRVKGTAFACR